MDYTKENKMRELRFKKHVKRPTETKVSNTPKNARTAPIPQVTPEEVDKLDIMLEALFLCNGKLYSELTLNEKRLVEMFCKRGEVNSLGATPPKNTTDDYEIFTVLKFSAYAHKFAVHSLNEYFACPTFKDFHVYEDERMNIDDLYGAPYLYSGHPMLDALKSWPKNYLPIRASKGKANLWAIYPGGSGKGSQSDFASYAFKERLSITPDEPLYQNPLLPRVAPVSTVAEESKTTHSIITQWNILQDADMTLPSAAAIYDLFVADPEAFETKYGEKLELNPEFVKWVEKISRDTDGYREAVDKFV